MKILIVCLMFYELSAQLVSLDRWQEELAGEPGPPSMNREDLLEAEESLFREKLPAATQLQAASEQVKRIASAGSEHLYPQSRLLTRTSCSCDTQYEIRDLGEGHYPRFLTASRCKPKTCQAKFHSCRLLNYMVHVLRQRDLPRLPEDRFAEDEEIPETPLPESLRHKWQLKPMSIGVACIPSLENRRN